MRNPFKKQSQNWDSNEVENGRLKEKDDSVLEEGSDDSGASSERGQWGGKLDFILSCLGYTVGLSNLWRFPYLCMRNGGGAFLIPYFTCLFLCGMPLYFLELVMGQFSSTSPLSVWNLCPLFKGIGWGMVIVSGILSIYYNLVVTWVLYYLGKSFAAELPWATCDNWWNTYLCMQRGRSNSTDNSTMLDYINQTMGSTESNTVIPPGEYSSVGALPTNASVMANATKPRTPAEEFWQFEMLQLTSGIHDLGGIRWELLLCLFAAWLLVFLCLFRGIKTSGKVVYVTATVPYLFLTILMVRGVMLPGASDGIAFYLTPNFSRLLEFKVWGEACLQIFYSLGPAWGGLITMSSYNKFNNNCLRDAIIVCLGCAGTSFYAGFVIFSVIGFMAKEANQSVDDVVTSGPGLAFIAYPEALTRLPISPLWAICFFLMLLTLGLDSQFSTFETTVSGFVDEFPKYLRKRKTLFTAFMCGAEFVLGIVMVSRGGMYVFQILDWYAGAFSAMVIALLECIVLGWIYGTDRLYDDIELMLGARPFIWWMICWRFITPFILFVITVFSCFSMSEPTYGDYVYPPWAIGIGWLVAMVSIIPIPTLVVINILREEGPIIERIRKLLRPTPEWGPALHKHRVLYKYNTNTHQVTPLVAKSRHANEKEMAVMAR